MKQQGEVTELSRAEALRKAGLAAGALYGLGAIGPHVHRVLAASNIGEGDFLSFSLKFEHLQVSLYQTAQRRLSLPRDLKRLVEVLEDEERQHVATLTASLGEYKGGPPERLAFAFAYRGLNSQFLRFAQEIETAVVAAYNGIIPKMKSKELRELLGAIVQVEGRHAAALRIEGKGEPAPNAFDPGTTQLEALDSVLRFAGSGIFR